MKSNTIMKPKQKTLVPMTNAARIRAYARQNGQLGKFRPSGKQARRIMKASRKARG